MDVGTEFGGYPPNRAGGYLHILQIQIFAKSDLRMTRHFPPIGGYPPSQFGTLVLLVSVSGTTKHPVTNDHRHIMSHQILWCIVAMIEATEVTMSKPSCQPTAAVVQEDARCLLCMG